MVEPDLVGTVTAELQLAPASVKCVNVKTVNGATTINTAFNVVTASNTAFMLTGLPVGNDTFSAQAYAVGCASIGGAQATYVSDNVTVAVSATPVTVKLMMRPASGATGTAIVSFPTPTGAVTDFWGGSFPALITPGGDGNLWFSEQGATKIGVLTPPYGWVTEYSITGYAVGIAVGPDGYVWFVEPSANMIGRITPGGEVSEYPVPTANAGLVKIAAGPDGNIWFTERAANKVGRFTPTTQTMLELNVAGGPSGIVAGPDGNVWLTEEFNNKVVRMVPPGFGYTEFGLPAGSLNPASITVGTDGNIWFVEWGSSKIGRMTPAGALTEFPMPAGTSNAEEIAAGPDGNLWVTSTAGLVLRVTTAGVFTTFSVPLPSSLPWGITGGPDGAMWFADYTNSRICRMSL